MTRMEEEIRAIPIQGVIEGACPFRCVQRKGTWTCPKCVYVCVRVWERCYTITEEMSGLRSEAVHVSQPPPPTRAPSLPVFLFLSDDLQVERIFDAIDVDHSGTISITEFVAASLAKQQINTRAIKAAFNRLDHGR